MPKRVLIVEDHALVALSLSLALSARSWIVETTDGPAAADIVDHAHRFGPRSVLLDIRLGDAVGCGIDLIGPFRATGAEIVMLTAETDQDVLASCLEAGAGGWIGKHASLDEVEAALGDVSRRPAADRLHRAQADDRAAADPPGHQAHRALAVRAAHPTRREVLALLIDGLAAEEIAETRYVALTTVRSQIRSVLRKLGVRSQLAAVACAAEPAGRSTPASSPSSESDRRAGSSALTGDRRLQPRGLAGSMPRSRCGHIHRSVPPDAHTGQLAR